MFFLLVILSLLSPPSSVSCPLGVCALLALPAPAQSSPRSYEPDLLALMKLMAAHSQVGARREEHRRVPGAQG